MFLRCKVRRKDGKQHRYWSVVENTWTARGRVVQRHVLYLGEINDTPEMGLYGVVEKPDLVVIVPLNGDRLDLVEQFRYPVGARYWELPLASARRPTD
jgi:hypothetical protein